MRTGAGLVEVELLVLCLVITVNLRESESSVSDYIYGAGMAFLWKQLVAHLVCLPEAHLVSLTDYCHAPHLRFLVFAKCSKITVLGFFELLTLHIL